MGDKGKKDKGRTISNVNQSDVCLKFTLLL